MLGSKARNFIRLSGIVGLLGFGAAACTAPAGKAGQDDARPAESSASEADSAREASTHKVTNAALPKSPGVAGDSRLHVITGDGIEVIAPDEVEVLTGEKKEPPAPGAPAPVPRKERSPYTLLVNPGEFETLIEVHPDTSATPLLTYELDPRVLRLQWDLERGEEDQVPDLVAMLKELTQEMQAAFAPAGFRVQADFRGYPSYAVRLARHATKDPEFRKITKAIRDGGDAGRAALAKYMMDLTRSVHLMTELDTFFAAFALQLEIEHVQGCSSSRSGAEGITAFRRKHHLRRDLTLPLGCTMSFKLVPMLQADIEVLDSAAKAAAEKQDAAVADTRDSADKTPADAAVEAGEKANGRDTKSTSATSD